MKTKQLFFLFLLTVGFCCFSCERTPTQTETPEIPIDTPEIPKGTTEVYPRVIETVDFKPYNYGCTTNYANMQDDTVYVINSEEEFAYYFTCANNPQIDFETQTLLFAFGPTYTGIRSISTELLAESNTMYVLKVEVLLAPTGVALTWKITIIVDKINPDNVSLELNKHR